MTNRIEDSSAAHPKDLLLEDYRNLADCFWKNEQSGETRVHLFIGLVSAAIGGLVTLASSEHRLTGKPLQQIIIASLGVLIVLGVVTLLRMLTRNETTDRYKQGCESVRQMFKDYFDSTHILLRYYPFAAPKDKKSKRRKIRKIGGLTHTVAVVNSLLVAGLAGAVVYPVNPAGAASLIWTYFCFAGTFWVAGILQFLYVDSCEKRAKTRLRKDEPSHAGGIVHRIKDNAVQYLLVGPKKDVPNEWLLPKGHIKDGEGHGEAALREVREEAGVAAQLICFVERSDFDVNGERVRGKYYLMEAIFESSRSESRRMDWFEFPHAHRLLTHEVDKHLLQVAEHKRAERERRELSTYKATTA